MWPSPLSPSPQPTGMQIVPSTEIKIAFEADLRVRIKAFLLSSWHTPSWRRAMVEQLAPEFVMPANGGR